ncbi:MAG: hypothetical protein G01um101433_862 [Parcubacteria group bacterium Gr01-1014_33]|nr:MAG: hypothetical protein G01um101433_862 [Parcubacteria group bacterium Gr01-1014_33]
MNPKQFLTLGGIVLALVGVLGMVGILGPTEGQSLFGSAWWFDPGENWAHLILGVVALIAAFALKPDMQKPLTLVVGIVALAVGVIGFVLPNEVPNFLGANLENPLDNILHLIVGLWAVFAWKGAKSGAPMGSM